MQKLLDNPSNTGLLHLLNSLTKRLDLQYNILICFKYLHHHNYYVKVKCRYLIESMNIIGNVFINSGGSDNLWCLGAKATQKTLLH